MIIMSPKILNKICTTNKFIKWYIKLDSSIKILNQLLNGILSVQIRNYI